MDESTFVSAGFLYLQQSMPSKLKSNDDDDDQEQEHEQCATTVLSEPAKRVLLNLLKQQDVQLKQYPTNIIGQSTMRSKSGIFRSCNVTLSKKIVDPEMSDTTLFDLAYKQEISLLGSILSVIDQYVKDNKNRTSATTGSNNSSSTNPNNNNNNNHHHHSGNSVTTKYIVQKCAYTVIPQKTPGLLSAREMITAALHFLSQEFPPAVISDEISSSSSSPDEVDRYRNINNIIPLPLIHSVSMPSDLERRSYEKSYDWDLATILPEIFQLEEHFYCDFAVTIWNDGNTSKKQQPNYLMWLPREMFLPRQIKDNELRRKLLFHASIPATPNESDKTSISNNDKNTSIATTNKSANNNNKKVNENVPKKRKRPSTTPSKSLQTETVSDKGSVSSNKEKRPDSGSTVKKIKITSSKKKLPTEEDVSTPSVLLQPYPSLPTISVLNTTTTTRVVGDVENGVIPRVYEDTYVADENR